MSQPIRPSPKTSPGLSPDRRPSKGGKDSDSSKMHKRSRSGCFTCRLRRKKCDETRPVCRACRHLNVDCEYKRPQWWQHPERRKKHKEVIKEIIRQTKLNEKPPPSAKNQQQRQQQTIAPPAVTSQAQPQFIAPGINTPPSLCHSLPTTDATSEAWTRTGSVESHFSPQFDIETPHDFFNSTPMMTAPQWTPLHPDYPYFTSPYEVDIKTERQMFVNDMPTQKDSVISTFTTFPPHPSSTSLPSAGMDSWVNQEFLDSHNDLVKEEPLDFRFFDFPHPPPSPTHQTVITVDECDQYLLNHFLENVTRLIFPILDANQHGSAAHDIILPALEHNRCYLHTCLSTAALHLKATDLMSGDRIDNDIMRHRYATIRELCASFEKEDESSQNLEATLGLILFQCAVGSPQDDLPDIPWFQHFTAAKALIDKLDSIATATPSKHISFNRTLASWIDILGATMLARVPDFAASYRDKIDPGESSGLAELMGCEDRVMYLISEISALESLKLAGLDSLELCGHITTLGTHLTMQEEQAGPALGVAPAHSPSGALRPKQLSRNITACFRLAARAYLCSLVPDFDRTGERILALVNAFAVAWDAVPGGPDGFDRALVWPLLMLGSYSTEGSRFRDLFARRCAAIGPSGSIGSFARVREILTEGWRINDEVMRSGHQSNCVHWRDVMQRFGGDVLLI